MKDGVFKYKKQRITTCGNKLFQLVVGYIFFPLAYIMGVNENAEETLNVAKLMGTKTALNEFVAYQHLSELLSSNPPKLSV